MPVTLPQGAEDYLRFDNPRLLNLEVRYAAMDSRVTTPDMWTRGHVNAYDLKYFRGDNAYVWQLRGGGTESSYALSAYYMEAMDRLGVFDRLKEDGSFGVHTFEVNGRIVSRDLLDSVAEIYFLERNLGISQRPAMRILDIGAGYGRLAWRMANAFDGMGTYLCADAVPVSSFICEYHLGFRGLGDTARMLPLDEVEATLSATPVDLAINIHSFSECTLAAINWWLELLCKLKVRYLMIVPNPQRQHGGSKLTTNLGEDFMPLIERCGFVLRVREPKYLDAAVQSNGVHPTFHYLFEARS